MQSTRTHGPADYLGVDLTDRYANTPRSIDVCGLTPAGSNRLRAAFWQWEWPSPQRELDLSNIAAEVRQAKSTMLDGPQGLAAKGERLRACERESRASGKTPDALPALDLPYAGFIRSSIELFSVFAQAGFRISPDDFTGVSEVYPGHIWKRLTKRALPPKSTVNGRRARKLILQELGVENLPESPTHDQNDACISAVMAAAADGEVPGMTISGLGLPLTVDDCGTLREGPMATPKISDELKIRIEGKLQGILFMPADLRRPVGRPDQEFAKRAADLRDYFVKCAKKGKAEVCTYAWAYKELFQPTNPRWSQAHAGRIISVAAHTPFAELPGLGHVRLDTFIVSSRTKLPGRGHWGSAEYDREAWERVLGSATILS